MTWKKIAIVSIIINIIFVLLFMWAYSLGNEMIEQEMECALNICAEQPTYWYDDYSEVCSCYNEYQEEVIRKYIGT